MPLLQFIDTMMPAFHVDVGPEFDLIHIEFFNSLKAAHPLSMIVINKLLTMLCICYWSSSLDAFFMSSATIPWKKSNTLSAGRNPIAMIHLKKSRICGFSLNCDPSMALHKSVDCLSVMKVTPMNPWLWKLTPEHHVCRRLEIEDNRWRIWETFNLSGKTLDFVEQLSVGDNIFRLQQTEH